MMISLVAKHDGYIAPRQAQSKEEHMTGYTEQQIHREKAMKRMGETEAGLADDHAKKLSGLGSKS